MDRFTTKLIHASLKPNTHQQLNRSLTQPSISLERLADYLGLSFVIAASGGQGRKRRWEVVGQYDQKSEQHEKNSYVFLIYFGTRSCMRTTSSIFTWGHYRPYLHWDVELHRGYVVLYLWPGEPQLVAGATNYGGR